MKKLFKLCKIQLKESLAIEELQSLARGKISRGRISRPISYLFILASILLLGVMMFKSTAMMCELKLANFSIKYALLQAAFFSVVFLGFNTDMFSWRDFNLVLPLPVKTGYVAISKMASLYVFGLFIHLAIVLPSVIAAFVYKGIEFNEFLADLICIPFMPFIPIIIISLFSLLLMIISKILKFKSFAQFILTIMGIAGYFFYLKNVMGKSYKDVMTAMNYMSKIIYPPSALFESENILTNRVLFIIISAILMAAYGFILNRYFFKLKEISEKSANRKRNLSDAEVFSQSEWQKRPKVFSLLKKEIRRLFSSYLYLLNSSVGCAFLIGVSVASFFFNFKSELDKIGNFPAYIMISIIVSLALMSITTTAVSTSLEGRSIDIIRSLPVSKREVANGKLSLNFLLQAICLIPALVSAYFVFQVSGRELLFIVFTSVASAVFSSVNGLMLNWLFPNYTWEMERLVIKQSLSVFLTIAVSGLIVFLNWVAVFKLNYPVNKSLAATAILMLIVSSLEYAYSVKKGF